MWLPQLVATVAKAAVVSALAFSSIGVTASTPTPLPPNESPTATITSSSDLTGFTDDETIAGSNEDAEIFAANDAGAANVPATVTETSTSVPATATPPSPTETSIAVLATATPPPTETSTAAPPTATPAPNSLICDVPATVEIAPGTSAEMSCAYTINDPGSADTVSASFANDPGDGWTLAFDDGPSGATAVWSPTAPLAVGQTIDVHLRVTAPADASPGQTVTVSATIYYANQQIAVWPITLAAPEEAADAGFSVMSVEPLGGICTQMVPGNTDNLSPISTSQFPRFRCDLNGLELWQLKEIKIGPPSAGWAYRVFSNQVSGLPFASNQYHTYNPSTLLPTFYIEFRLASYPVYPLEASLGTLTVEYVFDEYSCPGWGGCGYYEVTRSSTLTINWPAPVATCTLISGPEAVVVLGEPVTYKCTHANPPYRLEQQTAIDPHWLWAVFLGQTPNFASANFTSSPLLTEPASGPYVIFIRIARNWANPPEPGAVLDLQARFVQSGTNFVSLAPLTVTYVVPTCDPTAALTAGADFGGSHWAGEHYAPATADLAITISPSTTSGCSAVSNDWSVSIQSNGLYEDGDTENGALIPPEAITFQGTAPDGTAPAGLTVAPPITLDPAQPVTIATGNATGTGAWDIALQLQPPDDAPPGDYQGSITVTIASGS